MTNEELDVARAKKAAEIWDPSNGTLATTAARLAREGWTPPMTVDPDIAEAEKIWELWGHRKGNCLALKAIKRGRALAAEAKPGMVWVKHDGSRNNPLEGYNFWILADRVGRKIDVYHSSNDWRDVRHYAIINNPPEDVA